jgi:hypothetical protein
MASVRSLVITQIFFFAPEARWKLAGGGTAGMLVVIALRPGRGAGSMRKEKKFRSSKSRPAPLPGRDRSALSYRWFHRRLISTALSGRKARIAYLERVGQ